MLAKAAAAAAALQRCVAQLAHASGLPAAAAQAAQPRAPARWPHGWLTRRLFQARASQELNSSDSQPDGPIKGSPQSSDDVTLKDVASMLQSFREDVLGFQKDVQGFQKDVLDFQKDVQGRFEDVQGRFDDVQATLGAHGRVLGGLSERVVLLGRFVKGEDPKLRENLGISTADDVVRVCSAPGHPASKEHLLRGLGPRSPAFSKLFRVLGMMMREEAAALGAELPAFPSEPHVPHAVGQWLSKSRPILLAARPKGRGKPAWLPACKGLQAYAKAAGSCADDTSLLAFLEGEQGRLVVPLLAAWATGQLYERVEMDAEPILQVTSSGVDLGLLEIKSQPPAISGGVRQVKSQPDILLLALALSNAGLLRRGPLHVVGTVVVAAGSLTQRQRETWERKQLAVGGTGPAPQAAMQLRVRR
ncbi:hypothetical protein ABPG75_007273 [Micractinium tetrahymenae]